MVRDLWGKRFTKKVSLLTYLLTYLPSYSHLLFPYRNGQPGQARPPPCDSSIVCMCAVEVSKRLGRSYFEGRVNDVRQQRMTLNFMVRL